MSADESQITIHIKSQTRSPRGPKSWRPSRLLAYMGRVERALLAIDPDLEQESDERAFMHLEGVSEGSINIIAGAIEGVDLTQAVLVKALTEEDGANLPPTAHAHIARLIKLAKEDSVRVSVSSSNSPDLTWSIDGSTQLEEPIRLSRSRTSESGTIHRLNADTGIASMKVHERTVKLSGLDEDMVTKIGRAWGELGPNQARFRVSGIAIWDKVDRRVTSMEVDELYRVRRPNLSDLRSMLELIGSPSDETVKKYGRSIRRIENESLDNPEHS